MLFSSLPVFLSVIVPLSVLVLFGIIFEDRVIRFEQKLFCRIKRQFFSKKRKSAARSKRASAVRPTVQKREQFKRVA